MSDQEVIAGLELRVEELQQEVEDLKQENRELLEEYVLDAFIQECTLHNPKHDFEKDPPNRRYVTNTDGDQMYEHSCMSTYENMAEMLIDKGLLKASQLYRPIYPDGPCGEVDPYFKGKL